MSTLVKLFMIGAAVFAWRNYGATLSSQPSAQGVTQSAAALANRTIADDPCQGKAKCVMIFVAPWCGACKQRMPDILRARDSANGSTGVRVFTTSDEPDKLRAHAASMGGRVIVDEDQSFKDKWDVPYFPAFYVLDGSGQKILDGKNAVVWVYENILFPGKKFDVR